MARARRLAAEMMANVRFLEADVCHLKEEIEPVDFVFDRSCYEFVSDRRGYLNTLRHITRVGSKYLLIVRRSRKYGREGFDVAQILTELRNDFIFDDVASAQLRSTEEIPSLDLPDDPSGGILTV